jgi:hypothetical protein
MSHALEERHRAVYINVDDSEIRLRWFKIRENLSFVKMGNSFIRDPA